MSIPDMSATDEDSIMVLHRKWRDNQPPAREYDQSPDDQPAGLLSLPAELRNRVYDMLLWNKSRLRIKRFNTDSPFAGEELVFEQAALCLSKQIHVEFYSMMDAHAWKEDTTIIFTVTNFYFDKAIPVYDRIFGSKKNPSPVPKGGLGWRPKLMIRCDFDMNLHDYRVYNKVIQSMKKWFKRVRSGGVNDEIDYEVGEFRNYWTIQNPLIALQENEEDLWCDEFEKLQRRFECHENTMKRQTRGESRMLRLLGNDDTDDEMADDEDYYTEDEVETGLDDQSEKSKDRKEEGSPSHGEQEWPTAEDHEQKGEDDDLEDNLEGQEAETDARSKYNFDAEMNLSETEDKDETDPEELPDNELQGDADDWMPTPGYYHARRHGRLQGGDYPSHMDIAVFRQ